MAIYKYFGIVAAKAYLENQTIRFSTPDGYNDPFELKAKLLSKVAIPNETQPLNYKLFGNSSNLFQYLIENLEEYPYSLSSSHYADICEKIGMACFSYADESVPVNHLMWAHYAESHHGMAIKIKDSAETIPRLSVVNYCESQPILDAQAFFQGEFYVSDLYFKSLVWEYENERRLAIHMDQCAPVAEDQFGQKVYVHDLPVDDVEAVFLGSNASQELLKLGLAFHNRFGIPVIKQIASNAGFGFRATTSIGLSLSECETLNENYCASKA